MSHDEEIAINDEIALLKNYLEIEKLRFREKLNFSFSIDDKIDGAHTNIPTMLLQPVVENAVNHGIFNKEDNGNLTISFKKVNANELDVEIMDDGVGFAKTKKEHNGKINSSLILKDRLFYLNRSQNWKIDYSTTEVYPDRSDKGNISRFTIKKLR
jgi:LytS/YehU family sensor histidine kinase